MWKLLCVLVIIAVASQEVIADEESRLIGGQNAVNGQFPHHVQIRKINKTLTAPPCGGSIIGDRFVFTSSVCFLYNREPEDFKVIVGNVDIEADAIQHQVDKIIRHPNTSVSGNEIAVVRVAEPFIFSANVRAIQLPIVDLSIETDGFESPAILIGWRWIRTDDVSSIDRNLQWINETVISQAECKQTWRSFWRNAHMCSKHAPDTGLCTPIALGGLITQDAEPVLLGVFYLRGGGCPAKIPNLYIRVFPHLEFIRSAMQ